LAKLILEIRKEKAMEIEKGKKEEDRASAKDKTMFGGMRSVTGNNGEAINGMVRVRLAITPPHPIARVVSPVKSIDHT